MDVSKMWKVPFRDVYCESLIDCAKQTLWCHLVIKVFPNAADIDSDALVAMYPGNPAMLYDQYKWRIDRAIRKQRASECSKGGTLLHPRLGGVYVAPVRKDEDFAPFVAAPLVGEDGKPGIIDRDPKPRS